MDKCNHIFGYWGDGDEYVIIDTDNVFTNTDLTDGVVVFNYCPLCGGSFADPDDVSFSNSSNKLKQQIKGANNGNNAK